MPERRLLATAMLATAVTLTFAEVGRRGELPEFRQYLGLAVAFLTLSIVNDLGAEPVAAGLALLLMVAVMLARGEDALAYVGVRLGDPRLTRARARRRVRRFARQSEGPTSSRDVEEWFGAFPNWRKWLGR